MKMAGNSAALEGREDKPPLKESKKRISSNVTTLILMIYQLDCVKKYNFLSNTMQICVMYSI